MIRRYQRTARSFNELKLGELDPLVEALPELVSNAASAVGCGHEVPEQEIRDESVIRELLAAGHDATDVRDVGLRGAQRALLAIASVLPGLADGALVVVDPKRVRLLRPTTP